MTDYPYTKAVVVVPRLWDEIIAADLASATLEDVNWDSPDDLTITTNQAYSGEDETSLDAVVAAHDGTPLPVYSRYCRCCGSYLKIPALSEPTTCPCCGMTSCLMDTTGMSGLSMRSLVIKQDAEPTIAKDDESCIWIDTNDSDRVYLVFRRGAADQVKIELT